MSREVRRVEPLPSPFALPDDAALNSPLYSRVVFLALSDETAARALLDDLRAHDGVRTTPGPSRLFARGLLQPWGAFQQVSDVGLGALLSAGEFLTLLRALADDLLLPVAAGGDLIVEWTPDHASPSCVAAMRSLYPDAIVVTEPTSAEAVLDLRPPARDNPSPGHAQQRSLMLDRLIVIVGAGRSGTTWLEELLLTGEDIGGLSGHETWLFHQLRHLWRNFRGGDGPGLGAWLDTEQFVAALRRFCDGVLTTAQRRHSPHSRFYVEKTPAHVERLPEIAAVYPDAWVIHLIRDGRDVARSMSQVQFFDVPDPGQAAALWQRVMHRARLDAATVPRFREVRYEVLHDDPVALLHDIRQWVGATSPVDQTRLDDAIRQRVSTHAGTAHRVGSGSWRSMSPGALAAVYAAASDELVRAGYASRAEVWRARLRPAALLGQRSRKARIDEENDSGSSTQGK